MKTRGISPDHRVIDKDMRVRPGQQLAHNTGNVRFGGFAQTMFKTLPPALNLRVGGLSLEDFTARLMVWLIYLPQGIMAVLYRLNPFETWSRNIGAWLGSVGITLIGKHDKYGFNSIFNHMMIKPKVKNPDSFLERLFNRMRPEANYLQLLKEAGVDMKKMGFKDELTKESFDKNVAKKAFWSGLDTNEKKMLLNLRQQALRQKNMVKVGHVDQVMRRMFAARMLSVGTSAMLMAIVIGVLMQKAVFKFISPLDKRFTPRSSVFKGKGDEPAPVTTQKPSDTQPEKQVKAVSVQPAANSPQAVRPPAATGLNTMRPVGNGNIPFWPGYMPSGVPQYHNNGGYY
jgi:hypothetical protein